MKVLDAQLSLAQATLDASALTAPRTLALPDAAGTLALASMSIRNVSASTTLVAADAGNIVGIAANSAAVTAITVDPTVFQVGDVIRLHNNNAVPAQIVAAGGSVVNPNPYVFTLYDSDPLIVITNLNAAVVVNDAPRVPQVKDASISPISASVNIVDVIYTGSTDATYTIPQAATDDIWKVLPVGTAAYLMQAGAGKITVAGASGITLLTPNGAATKAPGDARVIMKLDTTTWAVL
jgi:hypothetical protein